MGDIKVSIAGQEIALQVPKSVTIRQQVAMAAARNVQLAMGAAIGACWPHLPKLKTKFSDCDYNVLDFGLKVQDELYDAGANFAEIAEAGTESLKLCIDNAQIVSQEEVDEAEDFLGDPDSTSGPPSKSRASGGKSRAGTKRKTAKRK